MKILIIGGTRFIGRHLVTSARARGHEVTLFNRGKSNPGLFRRIQNIRGDREKDLDQLSGQWDAVIDTCGYLPRVVRLSAEALKEKVSRYVFISSVSVYANFSKVGIKESDAVGTLADESVEEITGETYGPLKALCEKAVQDVYGARSLIIRPGLIVGPHDPTDRFTYWPLRIAKGGDVLTPDRPDAMAQFIDARDLADFIIRLIDQNVSGTFNAVGYPVTLNTIFETCKRISKSNANFKWAPIDFLEKNNVAPWSDMPIWVPEVGEDAGVSQVDVSKAVAAGLTFSPLTDTVKAIYDWEFERPAEYEMKAGLKPEREAELLKLLNHAH
ncbi:MAG TPA: NAD-dependent epimerase/dehydratase family protein [Anaerolineales bacterium]|nr:NAD-dependent epimerase/dehydratase family protein [Anaerolineales bacterium]HND50504.1 NAD-dependent epimerase/dehydratase family protein [Anaerolineales bacterium]HNE05156.1 NAD-dependent epimerase/dehydratase family protein [Anaerolineales bacterium]HNH27522.1 NAD-dependent epimerase/dehydratase family protein [Anaerolineales bacterium]HNM37348.1 NAD-dependent epimerase/dehydratase family protein [Anaerolineales bacterium]